jgi:hypothetical protein
MPVFQDILLFLSFSLINFAFHPHEFVWKHMCTPKSLSVPHLHQKKIYSHQLAHRRTRKKGWELPKTGPSPG